MWFNIQGKAFKVKGFSRNLAKALKNPLSRFKEGSRK
jgi:hypothetical protein